MTSSSARLDQLLDEHPESFAEQAGISLSDKPSPLFQLLVLTSLLSANLDPRLGLRTARALSKTGFTTAEHMADTDQGDRWQVLADAKYLRKEQTARQLGQLAEQCLERYDGDLRRLRDEAAGEAAAIADSITEFTGIGPTGADIFLREVQTVWPVVRPFADQRVLDLARSHGLPHTPSGLAKVAGTEDLAHVGAALIQADMADRRAD